MIKVIITSLFFFKTFATTIEANYEQIKTLKNANITLNSSGKIIIWDKGEIEWKQIKPFPFVINITDEAITQTINNTSKTLSNPIIQNLSKVLRDILNNDYNTLKPIFNITKQKDGQFKLTPKSSQIRNFIQEIIVSKSKFVNRVELLETSGNSLSIHFNKHKEIKVQ